MTDHWFGLRPNIEPSPDLYWGCRAIFRAPDDIDVLWDRQQFNKDGDKHTTDALWQWINAKGLPRLRKELVKQHVSTRDDILVTAADRKYTIIANPKRSHGYLYIGAWYEKLRRTSG